MLRGEKISPLNLSRVDKHIDTHITDMIHTVLTGSATTLGYMGLHWNTYTASITRPHIHIWPMLIWQLIGITLHVFHVRLSFLVGGPQICVDICKTLPHNDYLIQ